MDLLGGGAVVVDQPVVDLVPVVGLLGLGDLLPDLLGGDVLGPPGHDDHLLPDVVHVVLGGDVVPAHPEAACQRVADDGVPGTSHVHRPGGVGGGVLDVHPEAGRPRFPEVLLLLRDLLQDIGDDGRRVRGEVQIAVHGLDAGDEPARRLYGRRDLLRDRLRGRPERLREGEARHGQVRLLRDLLHDLQVGRGPHAGEGLDNGLFAFLFELFLCFHAESSDLVTQQRCDAAERPVEHLPLLGIAGDELDARIVELGHLEEVIDDLTAAIKSKHIARLRSGKCRPELGVTISDILISASDHYSNIAVSVIETAQSQMYNHSYPDTLKNKRSPIFIESYGMFSRKYILARE